MTTPILGFPEIEVGMWHRGKEAAFNELVAMLDAGLSGIFGDADLVAIAALSGTGIAVRTAANTWALRTTVAPASGLTITNPAGIAGNITFALANDLAALEGLAGTGIACRTAADTWAQRTITGTANQITVTNGNGVSGNPTLSLPSSIDMVGSATGATNVCQIIFSQSNGIDTGLVGDASTLNSDIYLISNTGSIRLRANGSSNSEVVLNTSGDLLPNIASTQDLGTSSNTWHHVYAEGIQFPATQVASANANNLDDYEEGTWTPVLTFVTPGTLAVVYSSQLGRYTKIGRLVTVNFIIVTSTFTLGTATGQLLVTGLPFAVGLTAAGICGYMPGFTPGADTQIGSLIAASDFRFYHWNNATGGGAVLDQTDSPTGVNKQIYAAGSYTV